jgi:NADPH2:quinone reductase
MHSATINQLPNAIRSRGHRGAKAPIVLGNEGSGMVEESGRFNPVPALPSMALPSSE